MADSVWLSEKDRRILQEALDLIYRLPIRPRTPRTTNDQPPPAPEVYIAWTGDNGVPSLEPETGTGTGTYPGGDFPGYATLDIYRIIHPDGGTPYLLTIEANRRVYNLTTDPIPRRRWIPVARDKWGSWLALSEGIEGEDTGTGTDENLVFGCGLTQDGATVSIDFDNLLSTGLQLDESGDCPKIQVVPDGTGTGTAEADCTPISLTQEQVLCEDGDLNVYTREVLMWVAGGCLNKSEGAWTLDRNEGNCDGAITNNIVDYGDIYEFTEYVENTIYYNQNNDTLNININGTWYTFYSNETTVVYYTYINNFTEYVEGVIYFNSYDQRLYINYGGYWYGFCPCYESDEGTGTGTGTFGVEPGTAGTSDPIEVVPGAFCAVASDVVLGQPVVYTAGSIGNAYWWSVDYADGTDFKVTVSDSNISGRGSLTIFSGTCGAPVSEATITAEGCTTLSLPAGPGTVFLQLGVTVAPVTLTWVVEEGTC